MATSINCNICGSDIHATDGATSVTCDLCGATVTIENHYPPPPVTATVRVMSPRTGSLMDAGWFFLQEGNWRQADVYFDKAKNIDPEHILPHIGRLCSRLTRIICKRLFKPIPP
jgi:hypothetical protein